MVEGDVYGSVMLATMLYIPPQPHQNPTSSHTIPRHCKASHTLPKQNIQLHSNVVTYIILIEYIIYLHADAVSASLPQPP